MITVLLDSVNKSQPDLNSSVESLLSSDYELNGAVNRSASEGAKFSLIMAMLEQDCTHRPHLDASKGVNQNPEVKGDLNYYRSNSLSADDTYWNTCHHTSQLLHNGQLLSAHLWLAMHPEPLSQHNKPDAIDEDVIANCSIYAQTRMQHAKEKVVKIDETGLYDILQALEPAPASNVS